MKLTVRHTFDCTPEQFWQMLWDPEYERRMQSTGTARRELIETRDEGALKVFRYKLTSEKPLPGPVAKVVGATNLSYEQVNKYNAQSSLLQWKVIPSVMADKVTSEGTFVVKPIAGGCERLVDGNITVKILLIGGKVEQAIINDVQQAYELAAKISREYIAEKFKKP